LPSLLQRQCACGNRSGGGECGACKQRKLQRKSLAVGATDSPLESEADRVADQILDGGAVVAAERSPLRVSRAPAAAASHEDEGATASVDPVLAAPGHALDAKTRTFMEPRFGRDFSHVRVHNDAQAQDSAQALDAAAYTVGRHVVFGADHYRPETTTGQRLLAHELTHVLQQGAGATSGAAAPTLQRQPKTSGTGGGKSTAFIKEVVVDQNTKQSVTASLSDGTSFTDECSTGKGHCCFDSSSGATEGGVCNESRSKQINNNCTPIGDFLVTKKIGSGPIPFWTQFHDGKSVALHDYDPLVSGNPLSHGCVRLHAGTAEKIFNGAVIGATKVKVKNLARPSCDDPDLQREWGGDFRDAGKTPPDGTMIDPETKKKYTKEKITSEKHHIRETRDELKSALGVGDKGLDAEVTSVAGGADVQPKIPRCVATATKEEQQVPKAQASGFLGADAATTTAKFTKALKGTANAAAAEKVVKAFGDELWTSATAAARAGGSGSDDRQSYWTRLMLESALRNWDPWWAADADTLRRLHAKLLQLLEQTSRGFTSATFSGKADVKRILISGFDPFGFPNGGDIRQSNLSGAAALALDGDTLTDGKVNAEVQSVVYPVRFGDFNEGIVENFLRPQLNGSTPPHLVMSISQGSDKFELEEYAGRRRSSGSYADNVGVTNGTPTKPIEAPGLAKGPEFLRTNVSDATLKSMRATQGRSKAITEETEVQDLPAGSGTPRSLPSGPDTKPTPNPAVGQAVEGSGGGYLSNEIFYRNALLRTSSGSNVPVIHLHTPALKPGAADATRNTLIESIRKILRAALPGI
jgi:pyrrolidone-carboxylate peptidase